ncbi:MAG: HD domain-containing protein [Elusimicrobia bacterium]|nr:HD domain-containing protein [Elusimicrobiota bacterium]
MELNLESSFSQIINALSQIIAWENHQRIFHAWRVAVLATEVARKITPEDTSQVFYASLLYDVGTVSIDETSLKKLSLDQQRTHPVILEHPVKGSKIVQEIPGLEQAAEIIMDHHERWDGNGYPHRKRDDEINFGAQCLRIAEAYDFYLQDNPQLDYDQTMKQLGEQKNKEFCASVYEAFGEVLAHNQYCREINRDECLEEVIMELQQELPPLQFQSKSDVIGVTLRVFARVIDAKHRYTSGHSQRVSQYSILLVEALHLDHDEVSRIKWASLLHDAGKVAIPQYILNKPGPLSEEEYDLVKRHPEITAEIIKYIDIFKNLVAVVRHHHEHFNGQGYPDKLETEQIPYLARVITLADAFDAMTSPRPYQRMKTIQEALTELERQKGNQFDGEIITQAKETFLGLTV